MVHVLADEIDELASRGFGESRTGSDKEYQRNLRPHQNAGLVAERIKFVAMLVMGATDGICAHFQNQSQIPLVIGTGQGPAFVPDILVTADSANRIGFAIEKESLVRIDVKGAQAEALLYGIIQLQAKIGRTSTIARKG